MQKQSWRPSENFSKERMLRYVLFPGILPRIAETLRGFRHFAFLIAILFRRAGIFNSNHSFLNPHNLGKYTLGDVLGTAAASLRYNRQSLPQTAIFLSVIGMMVIITLQLGLTIAIYFSNEAQAAGPLPANAFQAPNPEQDLALNFLAHMFGAYDFFNVPIGVGTGVHNRQVTPLHTGLHELLAFYNVMMMLMGAFIMGYYAVASFLETALTGIPFGRRFSGYAAPLRAVIAFAILMPMPMPPNVVGVSVSGFNAAQYMVLFAARQGSNFASNLFNIYLAAIIDPEHSQDYLATPTVPDVNNFVEGVFAMLLCYHANDRSVEGQRVHLGHDPAEMTGWWRKSDAVTDAWTAASVDNPGALLNAYQADLAGNEGGIGPLSIAAGPESHKEMCGVLTIPANQEADDAASTEDAWKIREAYLEALRFLVEGCPPCSGTPPGTHAFPIARDIVEMTMSSDNNDGDFGDIANLTDADRTLKDQWINYIRNEILLPVFQDSGSTISSGSSQWRQKIEADITSRMVYDKGWAGAALFYNDIAAANLILQNAAQSVPRLTSRPGPLDNYEATKKTVLDGMEDGALEAIKSETPKVAEEGISLGSLARIGWGGLVGAFKAGWRKAKQNVMNKVFGADAYEAELGESVGAGTEWFRALPTAESGYREPESVSGEFGEMMLHAMGFGALADIMNDDPREVSPLATMIQLGHALRESSLKMAILGIILGGFNRFGSGPAGNFFLTFSGALWTMGVFLANMLPLIPFIYFFFGVVQWGFSVFEAVVAAPMFALTHLRFTSGDDRLIPQNAVQGYLLIFEIFLRPLMLIFGLIAAIVIFSGAAAYLHDIFQVAAYTLLGEEANSGPLDSLIIIGIYVVMVYMLAMSTFKLITIIPLGIMRWFGLGAAASLDDVTREAERETEGYAWMLAAYGVAKLGNRRSVEEEGPVAVKTKDGKQFKLIVRPNGQMFAKMPGGQMARVKEVGQQGRLFLVDPTARGGLRPVQMVTGSGGAFGMGGLNAYNLSRKAKRDKAKEDREWLARKLERFGIGRGGVT